MNSIANSDNTHQRLAIYSVIAGVLTAGAAHAAPTASPLNFPINLEDTDGNYGGASILLDIDDNGQPDFDINVDFRSGDYTCSYGSGPINFYSSYGGSIEQSNNYYAGMISAGTSISSAMTWSNYGFLTGCNYEPGNFPPPSRGFVAISFTRGQNIHYGYLDVETYEGSLGLNILAACYESEPDTPIDAGDCTPKRTTSVPVGGAIPLTLGLLALGAAALRRRRRQH